MQEKRGSSPHPRANRPGVAHELRIVGGEWRGRRLKLAPIAAIRPTPDRVRETLFNWLQPVIRGSRCLDLFAGSGALGIEALSRGASEVVFVDRDARTIRQILAALAEFGARAPEAHAVDALAYLRGAVRKFDIVFVDPPFASDLLARACARLEESGWLSATGLVYLEAPHRDGLPPLPAAWRLLKAKRAGEVGYYLVESSRERGEESK